MPQLDKVTFFSQYFWLVLFFLSFYFFVLKAVLPTIVTIFKVRKKTLELIVSDVETLKQEESTVLSNYDAVLVDSFNTSRNIFNDLTLNSNLWIENSSKNINKTTLFDVNTKYLNTINEINKEYIAFNNIKSLV